MLVNLRQFWWKITLCRSSLFVWDCIVAGGLGGKREQMCFRILFCILLRYLRMNGTNSSRNIWFATKFIFNYLGLKFDSSSWNLILLSKFVFMNSLPLYVHCIFLIQAMVAVFSICPWSQLWLCSPIPDVD